MSEPGQKKPMPDAPLDTLETRLIRIEAMVRETWVMVLEMRHPEAGAKLRQQRLDALIEQIRPAILAARQ